MANAELAARPVASTEEITFERLQKKGKVENQPTYCIECSSLDFRRIFLTADSYFRDARLNDRGTCRRGLFVHSFHGRLFQPSNCAICQLFRSVGLGNKVSDDGTSYSLVAFSIVASEHCVSKTAFDVDRTGPKTVEDEACLAVISTPPDLPVTRLIEYRWEVPKESTRVFICRTQQRSTLDSQSVGIWGRTVALKADFETPKHWLDFCKQNHRGNCVVRKPGKRCIRIFKVIDCHTNPPVVVERSWKEQYVALSYVWGPNQPREMGWSKVVLDAILATGKLGFRYLWVDKHCIDQGNAEEKNYLISRMASIYEGAELTIVAAAGSDSSHGLPGVESVTRQEQPCVFPGNLNSPLVSSLRDPQYVIRSSVWFTRGWTYQEGFLSRKRLIFTDEQMYWECHGMATHESINIPLQSSHTVNGHHMCSFMKRGIFNPWFGNTSGNQNLRLEKLTNCISEFSRRELSYDKDILLALQGISERFSTNKIFGLHLLCGIPVPSKSVTSSRDLFIRSFTLSLTFWAGIVRDGEFSDPFKDHSRRSEFPSWSWAGWKGPVAWGPSWPRFNNLDILRRLKSPENYVQVPCLKSRDEFLIDLGTISDFSAIPNLDQPNYQTKLHFSSPFVMRELNIVIGGQEKSWHHCKLQISVGLSINLTILTLQDQLRNGQLLALLIYVVMREPPYWPHFGFLLLRKSTYSGGQQLYERVGRLLLEESYQDFVRNKSKWDLQKVVNSMRLCRLDHSVVVE